MAQPRRIVLHVTRSINGHERAPALRLLRRHRFDVDADF